MASSIVNTLMFIYRWTTYILIGYAGAYYFFVWFWGWVAQTFLRSPRAATRLEAQLIARDIGALPGLTIVMPAFNEAVVIVDCVGSALRLDYPELEIIVVSDGSTDETVEAMIEAFSMSEVPAPKNLGNGTIVGERIRHAPIRRLFRSHLYPNLVVVDKTPAGAKGDGGNCGAALATKPWIAVMDADELVDKHTLIRAMTEIVNTNANVVACGVTLLPTNECHVEDSTVVEARVPRNFWAGVQLVEYLAAFFMSRPGLAAVDALHVVSGGFGIFKREALFAVEGFTHPHLGEDMDLIVKLHRYHSEHHIPYKVLQVPEAIVWTEFPSNRAVLKRQRMRWHRGLRQIVTANKRVTFNRRYGSFGMVGMPTIVFFEWYSVFLESAGWLLLIFMMTFGGGSIRTAVWLMAISQLIGACATTAGIVTGCRITGQYRRPMDRLRLFGFAVISQVGYRQLTLYWRLRSLFGKAQAWGVMPRTGFSSPAVAKKPPLPMNPATAAVASSPPGPPSASQLA
jgi:cellulose synthase/poly-beta-1,6-N-acetylglucosamine synthase-like glycosyltransferase